MSEYIEKYTKALELKNELTKFINDIEKQMIMIFDDLDEHTREFLLHKLYLLNVAKDTNTILINIYDLLSFIKRSKININVNKEILRKIMMLLE